MSKIIILNGSKKSMSIYKYHKLRKNIKFNKIIANINEEQLYFLKTSVRVKSYYLYNSSELYDDSFYDVDFITMELYDDFINVDNFK